MEWNRVWMFEKGNFYLRLYPNPGFCVRYGNTRYKWSKFYGFKKERI